MQSRIAPRFAVPRKTAPSRQRRQQRGHAIAALDPHRLQTFANRLESSWSSPKLTRRSFPCQSSQTIASRSGSCLSHTSRAML